MKKIRKVSMIALILVAVFCLGACTQAERVTQNISQEADNFNVRRRITVFNVRTDKVLFQMTGYFSLNNNSSKELEVICEIDKGRYTKHFVRLNEWTTYIVEDLNGAEVSKYSYELNFQPEMIPGVKIVRKD